jgi:hypothetical protein
MDTMSSATTMRSCPTLHRQLGSSVGAVLPSLLLVLAGEVLLLCGLDTGEALVVVGAVAQRTTCIASCTRSRLSDTVIGCVAPEARHPTTS